MKSSVWDKNLGLWNSIQGTKGLGQKFNPILDQLINITSTSLLTN